MSVEELLEIQQEMVFKLNDKKSPSDANLLSFEWAIVTQLNGEKTVGQIGEALSLNPAETKKMFSKLSKEGLIIFVEILKKNNFVLNSVFEELEYQFTYYMGPVSGILIEETLGELKRTKDNLEQKQLPLLIELLSMEISNADNRYEFQKKMLNLIKGQS